jgi:predicted aconitase
MRLTDLEQEMLDGKHGAPRKWAIQQQMRVGRFFDAEDFVEVAQVHLMADTESLGEAGVQFLERMADAESLGPVGVEFLEKMAAAPAEHRRVRVPTVTDPRGIDFDAYRRLGQTETMAELERRAIAAFRAMDFLLTDTCINYQTIMPPVLGEHLAFGDTGSTIYANSVMGARSNFEAAPPCRGADRATGTAITWKRRATQAFILRDRPTDLAAGARWVG